MITIAEKSAGKSVKKPLPETTLTQTTGKTKADVRFSIDV